MHHKFSPRNKIETLPKESRLVLALEALKKYSKLSIRKAAIIYKVPETSLHDVRKQPRSELPANSYKLTDLEEKVIIKRVLDLDARGFQARLSDIQEMADRLRANRNASANGFVKFSMN